MKEYLVFRLYGPLAAWGEIAVGESRYSGTHPGKSAIIGILAAALGIKRDAESIHMDMVAGFGIGMKMLSMGTALQDYHTTQVPPHRKKVTRHTRKQELSAEKLGTILSSREYRCDSLYVVAVWIKDQVAPFSLDQLRKALRKPIFTLYLGRKSCPLALPSGPLVFQADSLKSALDSAPLPEMDAQWRLPKSPICYFWEETDEHGMPEGHQINVRHDLPTSRLRWQFAPREEIRYTAGEEG